MLIFDNQMSFLSSYALSLKIKKIISIVNTIRVAMNSRPSSFLP